jgi:hypothetical protein
MGQEIGFGFESLTTRLLVGCEGLELCILHRRHIDSIDLDS